MHPRSDVAVSQTPKSSAQAATVPHYLAQAYWWAYVHPQAVQVFERDWLVSAILFGNYARLREAALDALGTQVSGHTLQLACVYGNLTGRLLARLDAGARLDVVDVLPIQLQNLAAKLPADSRVALLHGDSSRLACADARYDQVLLFFLLHEQPGSIRRETLAEALRVVKPGGRVVIVDYHRPAPWHPMRPLMRLVFRHLEPYAIDLWREDLTAFMPTARAPVVLGHRTFFGGLYQLMVLTRDG